MGASSAELIEHGRQVSELGTMRDLGHGITSKKKHSAGESPEAGKKSLG
jgi:hypothetical protein